MRFSSLSENPYFWLVYFSIAAGMGYWNWRKGHSFPIGMFVSVLLTPVAGLLFNLFSKPNKAALRDRAKAAPPSQRCPSCNAPVPDAAKRCKSCGKKLIT